MLLYSFHFTGPVLLLLRNIQYGLDIAGVESTPKGSKYPNGRKSGESGKYVNLLPN